MRTLALLILASLLTAGGGFAADEPVNPDEKGIFDLPELDVPGEDEKKARETVEQQELRADAALPDEVRRMLDRLTVFEVVETDVLGKRITPLRTALKDKLLARSDKVTGQAKIDYIYLAKYVEGRPVEEALRPESITVNAGADGGGQLWVNIGGDQWRIRRKDTAVAATARKPLPEALRLLTETAKSESALRERSTREIARRRSAVSGWLVEKAKTAPPAAAVKMLARAGSLHGSPGAKQLERCEQVAGVWRLSDGRKLEFRPDGALLINGKAGQATWDWAKARNWKVVVLLFGKPEEATEAWLARLSSKEPGTLRIITREGNQDARLE